VKIHLLVIEDAAGRVLPLVAYEDWNDASETKRVKMNHADVQEAMNLLGARYVVLSVEYQPKSKR
jgi:hypothetical protein